MKSIANIKGHPLHPILVSFPIALLTGALLLDLLVLLTGNENFLQAALYAEAGGLISAPFAALPGILDYRYTVPPESSAKKRALKHGLLNTTSIVIFSLALWLRIKTDTGIGIVVLLETAGVILIGIAGWLGGTLIIRNQIGVDHRYAHAGKWKTKRIWTNSDVVEVPEAEDLKINQMMLLIVNSRRIVIARTETGLVAFDDRCTHRGGPLADGVLICGIVQCPWHGSQFQINTGEVKAGPAKDAISSYPVRQDPVLSIRIKY